MTGVTAFGEGCLKGFMFRINRKVYAGRPLRVRGVNWHCVGEERTNITNDIGENHVTKRLGGGGSGGDS